MQFDFSKSLIFIAIYIGACSALWGNTPNYKLLEIDTFINNIFTPSGFYGEKQKQNSLSQNIEKDTTDTLPTSLEYDIEHVEIVAEKVYAQASKRLNLQLADRSANNLAQSLSKVAGVNSINTGIGIGKPVIRGQFGNRISVQQNGVKQEGQQWGNDHGLEIDAMDIENVVILKGAMTLEHGGDASGGVILLDDNITINKGLPKFTGKVATIYKSNNAHAGISTLLQGNFKSWNIEGRFTYQDYGDYKVPAQNFYYNGYNLPIYDNTLKNTAGKELNTRIAAAYEIGQAKGRFIASAYQVRSGLFTGAVGTPRAYNLASDGNNRNIDFPRQEVGHYKLAYAHEQSHIIGNFDLEGNISYQLNQRKEMSLPHAHATPLDYNGNANLALGLDLQTIALNVKLENYTHKIGLSANWQQNRISGFEFLIPAYTHQQVEAFYLYKLVNKKANFVQHIGARLSFMNINSQSFSFTTADPNSDLGYNIQNRAEDFNRVFFNYALAWSAKYYIDGKGIFSDNFMQFNLSKLYRNPTINELAANGIHHGTFRHEKGNVNLNPEEGFQANITYKMPATSRLNIELSAFSSYYSNYIYLHATGRYSTLPEGGQLYQYKQDKAILTGAEIEWTYSLPLANEKQNLSITQAYEYVYNQNINTKTSLPFTPPFHLRSSLDWQYKHKANTCQISLIHEYYAAQNQVDRNEKTTPSYNLVHLQAMYQIQRNNHQNIQVSLQVNNLFNTAYFNHLSRYRLLNLPEQGRNVMLSLALNF